MAKESVEDRLVGLADRVIESAKKEKGHGKGKR